MASLYNADLKPLAPGVATHPYDHATKLFVADNMRLAPKQKFLFYVVINIDVGILQNILTNSQSLSDPISSQSLIEQYEAGLMAKRVDLPKFTMNTKTMNAYNRKNIIQTHMTYDPITISFHDDAADIITNFWNDYYTYYYRDSDYDQTLYQIPHKYQQRNREGWGYTPRNGALKSFLRSIQIFSLHNKRFTEYMLVNPFITSWRHGEHDSYGGAETMENSMTVAYETVKYRTGYVNPVDVNGFSILHYDNFNSPISTSTTNIYSDAGLLGSIEGAATDLARPDGVGSGKGILSSVLSAYRFYNGIKGANFSSLVSTTIGQIGTQILGGAINGAVNGVFFPTASGTPGYGGVYGSSQVYGATGITGISPYAAPLAAAGVTIASRSTAIVAGSAATAGSQLINSWTRGIDTALGGPPANGSASRVFDVQATNGVINIDPRTGQPVTGTVMATYTDEQGRVTSQFTTTGTQSGTYNPAAPTENLVNVQTTKDQAGNTIVVSTYRDGTKVTEDADGAKLSVVPGTKSSYNPAGQNTNPTNARNIAAATGQPPSAAVGQFYTDPKTGITYTVNGGLSGQITNIVTGTAGSVSGLVVGSELNNALQSSALGSTVIGRTVATATSTAVGAAVGRAVNNGLQPIVNKLTGAIEQGFDSVTGEIKTVVGSWFGSGSPDTANPTVNLVSVGAADANGNQVYTYRDGTKITFDEFGDKVSEVKGSSGWDFGGFSTGATGQNTDGSNAGSAPGSILVDSNGFPTNIYDAETKAAFSPQPDTSQPLTDTQISDLFGNGTTDYQVADSTNYNDGWGEG